MSIVERYVHDLPKKNRCWDQDYLQFVSIDPGKVNFAFRIERRYKNGKIIPIAFWKQAFGSNVYQNLLKKLDEFEEEYKLTHIVVIEKQPPKSVAINRIMQHALTYFMVKLKNYPLLPEINEISPHLKGNELGAPPDINLKKWASGKARELLNLRQDNWSLEIMDSWLNSSHPRGERKDDDLADTIVMIEAYCKKKNYPLTNSNIYLKPRHINIIKNQNNSIQENKSDLPRCKIRIVRIKNLSTNIV